MGVFVVFLWHLVSHYWWFLTSSPLIVESVLNLFFDYENWIEQYIPRQKRKQITYGLALLGIIVASFFAFKDVYLELQTVRHDLSEAQKMLAAKGPEKQAKSIEMLQGENKQLQAELSSTRDQLSALQVSLKPRRLTAEERDKFAAVLASHDGQQFGVIIVRAIPSCHECMTLLLYDIVDAINSVPTWAANGAGNYLIKVDFSGIGIGMKDPRTPPPGARVLADALKAAGLQFTIETKDLMAPDSFILDVGNKP